MHIINIHDDSIKYLEKVLVNLSLNKSINYNLINNINSKYLLFPNYLISDQVFYAIMINPKLREEFKDLISDMIIKLRARKNKAIAKSSTVTTTSVGPTSTGSSPARLSPTGPTTTGSTSTGTTSTGPTSTGPTSTGPSPTRPSPTGPPPAGPPPAGPEPFMKSSNIPPKLIPSETSTDSSLLGQILTVSPIKPPESKLTVSEVPQTLSNIPTPTLRTPLQLSAPKLPEPKLPEPKLPEPKLPEPELSAPELPEPELSELNDFPVSNLPELTEKEKDELIEFLSRRIKNNITSCVNRFKLYYYKLYRSNPGIKKKCINFGMIQADITNKFYSKEKTFSETVYELGNLNTELIEYTKSIRSMSR
jgi:hypothetical protein